MWRLLLVKSLWSVALATNNYGLEGCFESGCMNIKTQPELDAWMQKQSSHANQFVPAAFQHYAQKTLTENYQKNLNLIAARDEHLKSYGKVQDGDYERYVKQYAAAHDGKFDPNDPCQGEVACHNAKNKEELDAWKESSIKNMKNFVPGGFHGYASQGLDAQYAKRLNEIENPPAKDEADVLDGHDKDSASSANFLAQKAEESGLSSSALVEVKTGVVCFAWAGGAWVLLVLLYKKVKGSQLSMLARAPEPAFESYTSI